MIDKKKVMQRVSRGSRLPEYPLLNLYTLVSIILQAAGEGFGVRVLRWGRPLPELMMGLYVRAKSGSRQHLVPQLIGWSLLTACVAQTVQVFGAPLAIFSAIISVTYALQCVAFSIG